MLVYGIVGITALAGLINAPWWAAVAGGCLLILVLSSGHAREPAFGRSQTLVNDATRMMATIINGTAGAALAFAAGRGSALLWGL
jgi:hypothetical protein